MTQRVFVAVLTVVVFLAGYSVRMVTERGEPLPPPPAALAREFATASSPAPGGKNKAEVDRAKIVAEIQKLRPQIEAYSAQVQEIYADWDREVDRKSVV